jgi:hypothetical protein
MKRIPTRVFWFAVDPHAGPHADAHAGAHADAHVEVRAPWFSHSVVLTSLP